MRTGVKFTAAWLAATIVAVVVAAAAVASVRSHVTDEPTQLGSPAAAALASDLPTTVAPSTTSTLFAESVERSPTTTEPSPTTTMASEQATTTLAQTSDSAPPSTSTTTTTQQPTTTTQASESYSKTFDTDGGSVRVVVDGDNVTFGGAVPHTGWKVELKKPGPEEVKVEFEQNDGEIEVEFSARVEDGELRVEISGDDHDD